MAASSLHRRAGIRLVFSRQGKAGLGTRDMAEKDLDVRGAQTTHGGGVHWKEGDTVFADEYGGYHASSYSLSWDFSLSVIYPIQILEPASLNLEPVQIPVTTLLQRWLMNHMLCMILESRRERNEQQAEPVELKVEGIRFAVFDDAASRTNSNTYNE